jgi:hypothetical protein
MFVVGVFMLCVFMFVFCILIVLVICLYRYSSFGGFMSWHRPCDGISGRVSEALSLSSS